MSRVGIYPGSFNPPTTAHVAIAEAAVRQRNLDRIVLAHSPRVLGKDEVERPLFQHRIEVLAAVADDHEWLDAAVTEHSLLVDIADGYDVLVMGADKWHQIQEVTWYRDETHRDTSMARLPELAVAPRAPLPIPNELELDLATAIIHGISSTEARGGRLDLMAPAARAFAEVSGAWIDAERYERWLAINKAG